MAAPDSVHALARSLMRRCFGSVGMAVTVMVPCMEVSAGFWKISPYLLSEPNPHATEQSHINSCQLIGAPAVSALCFRLNGDQSCQMQSNSLWYCCSASQARHLCLFQCRCTPPALGRYAFDGSPMGLLKRRSNNELPHTIQYQSFSRTYSVRMVD